MTKKWNLIVDVARCENCHNCSLAVKDEHICNDFPGYAAPQPKHGHEWIRIERRVRGEGSMVDAAYMPTMCNHCDNAPCMKAAPDVVRKRADGIVIIDPDRARGRRDLVAACPYGAIWWNEELQLPQAWIFDAHLLDQGWKEPRCAQACPTGAIRAVKNDDAQMCELAATSELEVLKPELGTRPRVYYQNIRRFNKCFVGGSVVAVIAGRKECVEGATVVLAQGNREVQRAQTDAFGDFKFDGLSISSGAYDVSVSHRDCGRSSIVVVLGESMYVGEIELGNIQSS